jgi:uncharacterized protein YhdP
MLRRLFRFALRLVLVVSALAVALAAAIVWRLQQGPVPLDFLVPRLKAAVGEDAGGWQVDVDGLDLVWDASDHQVELRAHGLRLERPGEANALALASVRVRLKRSALLRGEVVIRAIEITGPKLQLVRTAAGRVTAEATTETGAPRDLTWLWAMVQRLEHVGVRQGEITFVDQRTSTSWVVPRVDGDVWRWGGPLRVQIGLALGSGETAIPIWLEGLYRIEPGTIEISATSPGTATPTAFAAWPSTLAPEAHAWVTKQIQGGRVHDLAFTMRGHVTTDEERALELDDLQARVGFTDLSVRYLDTMPAATDVDGEARFTDVGMHATVARGKVEGLEVGPSTVDIAWPPNAPNRLAVDVAVQGPLASMITVLDTEPVALGERVSVSTRDVAGRVTARVGLGFPLDGRPKNGKLGLHAKATVTDADVPYAAGDWDLRGGAATIVVDDHALDASGTVAARGVPLAFRFAEHFSKAKSRRLELSGRLDDQALRALEIDPGVTLLSAPVDVTARIASEKDGRTFADVAVDLAPVTLDLPSLAIDKAAGEPARLVTRLALTRGVIGRVEHFGLTAGAVRVVGNAGRPQSGGPWSQIDANAFFALPDAPDDPATLTLSMHRLGEDWETTLGSTDVGRILRAYGYERARGGKGTFAGQSSFGPGFPFTGTMTVEHTTFSGVPWLVKLVSLASLKGLMNLGSEQTIAIDRLVALLAHRPPVLEIVDATASGPNLTLKFSGTIDHAQDVLDLQGTLIPSYYRLNEGAGRIPLIGGMIDMATGGAVQAVNFTVKGSRAEPVVSVHPISSLAPGVLREWLRKLGL